MSQTFYIAVTQQILLFRAETWVLTAKMEKALDTFQGRVAQNLIGKHTRRGRQGGVVLTVTVRSDEGGGDRLD